MNALTTGPITNKLDQFTRAYLECALWSSVDSPAEGEDNGEPLDENYSWSDLAPEALEQTERECAAFWDEFGELIEEACYSVGNRVSLAGHDFWLTRNGHGAGFWDGEWPEPAASRLTAASKAAGSRDLCVGDNGQLYFGG